MEGCKLKYILKVIKYQKQNGLPNTLLLLLIKMNYEFLKSGSHVYLKLNHMFFAILQPTKKTWQTIVNHEPHEDHMSVLPKINFLKL